MERHFQQKKSEAMSRLHEYAVIPSVIPSVTDSFCDSCVSGLLSCPVQYRREKSLLGPQAECKLSRRNSRDARCQSLRLSEIQNTSENTLANISF